METKTRVVASYDVDTQRDFMYANGALPVPRAEEIIPNLEQLTKYFAAKPTIKRYKSKDKHFGTEEWKPYEGELSKWGGPFPDHCMYDTEGQTSIPETTVDELVIENTSPIQEVKQYTAEELDAIVNSGKVITFEKQSYSVFPTEECPGGNKYAEQILKHNGITDVIMYGVATDICVKAAAIGMRKLGINVYLVTDAIEAVNVSPEDGEKSLQEMYEAGVKPITTAEVLEGKI